MKRLAFPLILLLFLSAQTMAQSANRQVFWRNIQAKYAADTTKVVRVYLDKFGYFYPSTAVAIDQDNFYYPPSTRTFKKRLSAKSIASANVYEYFHLHNDRQQALFNYYRVTASGNYLNDYRAVEEKELQNLNRQVHQLVTQFQAKTVVFLIHGFNVADPTDDYDLFIKSVGDNGYNEKVKPVYVEIYWDGLTAEKWYDYLAIWEHAQNNTRWISLSVRNLIQHLTDRLNFVIVTHSLGASVGTGALFNTSSKWKLSEDKAEVDSIAAAIPAPVDVPIRLGMIVPAIPGGATFVDFDKRSPDIIATRNNINRIIIGYNPLDYATKKVILSKYFGATTLGCDNGYGTSRDELSRVAQAMAGCGYNDTSQQSLLFRIHFTSPPVFGKYEDHSFGAYMRDQDDFKTFLTRLFE